MLTIDWQTTIASILLSGITSALISAYFLVWLEKNKLKRDCARRLFAHRFQTGSAEYNAALNEIVVTFDDDSRVVEAHSRLRATLGTAEADPALVNLYREVLRSAGLKHTTETDAYYRNFMRMTD